MVKVESGATPGPGLVLDAPSDDIRFAGTIYQAFAARVHSQPEACALIVHRERWSYAEILQCTDQLAAELLRMGLDPEEAVAIWGGRSAEFVVAALAIMKVGCAYVPLDIESPHSRAESVMTTASVRLIVAFLPGAGGADCPFGDALRPVTVGGSARAMSFGLRTRPVSALSGAVAPVMPHAVQSPLAFIMFTSGSSSGRAKGVLIEHASVLSLIDGMPDYVDLSPGRIVLNLSRTSFDATTFEIWGALLRGSSVAIHSHRPLDLEEFREFLQTHQVDTAWLTAGLFHEIMQQDPSVLEPIQQLLVGGDIVSPSPFNLFLTGRPGRRIVNGYGPTEATTFTTTFAASGPLKSGDSVPIGRPIRGTRAHILTRDLKPIPQGEAGELHIAGAGLARGYIGENRRKRDFLWGVIDGVRQRVYASGDFVRMRDDGNLEYLGRDDEQIKIRGFRVELAEIERALESLPDVRQAVVVPRRGGEAVTEIVALIVLANGRGADHLRDLRSRLRNFLPEYMLPSRWFVADAVPLNPNGKVDRIRIAEQGWGTEPLVEAVSKLATGGTARAVVDLWEATLKRPAISPDDVFSDVGGNSLNAVRIVAKLKARYGVGLTVSELISGGTARKLAELIDSRRSAAGE